jgi:ClpP class serine protease
MPFYPKDGPTGCRASSLLGPWYIDPDQLGLYENRAAELDWATFAQRHADKIEKHGDPDDVAETVDQLPRQESPGGVGTGAPVKPYHVTPGGVAVIRINGPTTKYTTSFQDMFGGTSTIRTERLVRLADNDPDVRAKALHIEDAPGGTVAGAYELRDALRASAKRKPFAVHIDGQCTSAAYLFAAAAASNGGRITAYDTSFVGNIGTRAHLDDTSEAFAKAGVKRITFTGNNARFKAAGMPGTVITDDQRAEMQKHVDNLNNLFITSVAEDRKIDSGKLLGYEARVFMATDAVNEKLIDGTCTFDKAIADFTASVAKPNDKPTDTGTRDPVTNPADPVAQGATSMNFLQRMAQLLGMSADATEDAIVQRVTSLRDAAPKTPDAAVLNDRLSAVCEVVNARVETQKMPVATATEIQSRCGAGAKPTDAAKPCAVMLTPLAELAGEDGTPRSPAMWAASLFATKAEPGPKTGTESPADPVQRDVPGSGVLTQQQKDEAAALEAADKDVAAYKANQGLVDKK